MASYSLLLGLIFVKLLVNQPRIKDLVGQTIGTSIIRTSLGPYQTVLDIEVSLVHRLGRQHHSIIAQRCRAYNTVDPIGLDLYLFKSLKGTRLSLYSCSFIAIVG